MSLPEFYTRARLAPYCYLSEAVQFLSLGRLPVAEFCDESDCMVDPDGDFFSDIRFAWDNLPDFQDPSDWEWFEANEFAYCGIKMPENYAATAESFYFGQIAFANSTISLFGQRDFVYQGPTSNFEQRAMAELEYARKVLTKNEQQIKEFHETNRLFLPKFERAWAKIFQFVADGRLMLFGISDSDWEEFSEGILDSGYSFLRSVAPDEVRLTDDFRANYVSSSGPNEWQYFAACFETNQLIGTLFPVLKTVENRQLRRLGANIVDVASEPQRKQRRGARPAIHWETLKGRLAELANDDLLPHKKEACIAQLQEIAELELGRKVSRTAVQVNLKEVLDICYS